MSKSKYTRQAEMLGLDPSEQLPYLTTLFLDLRSSTNGASDPYSPDRLVDLLKVFQMRVDEWDEPSDAIDKYVKAMCVEGIKLAESELSWGIEETSQA